MHGYRYPTHEQRLAEIAQAVGFEQISVSHRVAPLIKLIGRGDTTVVDAYLSPVLRRHVERLQDEAGETVEALFMQSNGGLAGSGAFHGKDAILSGPAGGIVGMAVTAREAGFDRVIGFDMGGTSTDVSHYAGVYERDSETDDRRRPHPRADDAHPYSGSGRRFDLRLRRGAVCRRSAFGGGGAGADGLSPGRAAHRHRLQCAAG